MAGGGNNKNNQGDARKKIFTGAVIISTIGLCLADTLTIVSLKIQGTTHKFKYSGVQTFLLFIGEYFNLIVFSIPLILSKKYRNKHFKELKQEAEENELKLKFTKLWCALPCLIECLSSGLLFTSLLLLPASISNMLQGAQIVATCLFSKWINNNPILIHHYVGVGLATFGFFLVGLAGYKGSQDETYDDMVYTTHGYILGLLCILGNLVFHSLQTNIEEKIMRTNAIQPQRIVGLEGMFGMIWMFGIVMILNFIPCPESQLCMMGGYYEDVALALDQIVNDKGLMFWCFVTCFAIFFFNLCGMILIQRVNAVYKVFWDNTLSIFIWATCVVLGFEKIVIENFGIQAGGYVFLILGNLTYNEIIRFRFWGLDKDLASEIERDVRLSLGKLSRSKIVRQSSVLRFNSLKK